MGTPIFTLWNLETFRSRKQTSSKSHLARIPNTFASFVPLAPQPGTPTSNSHELRLLLIVRQPILRTRRQTNCEQKQSRKSRHHPLSSVVIAAFASGFLYVALRSDKAYSG